MKLLVRCGEAYRAERLVKISSAVIPWTPGNRDVLSEDVWRDLLRKKFNVPVYCSAQTVDRELWREMGTSEEQYERQREMNDRARDLGVALTCTCAPYTVGYCPMFGSHVSSEESACIPYLNSVIGARTHRESSFTHLASAIIGKTSFSGLHVGENRAGDVLVEVKTSIQDVSDYDALGYYVGEHVGLQIPVFTGLRRPYMEHLKSLGSAMSTSGPVGLYHVVGVTPEAPDLRRAFGGKRPSDKIVVGNDELVKTREKLSTIDSRKIEFVVLGCPHYSIKQIEQVVRILRGRKVHRGVKLWIFTAEPTRLIARRMGLDNAIRKSGGLLLADTCVWNSGIFPSGAEVMATDSAKHAHYIPAVFGLEAIFGSTRECINAAVAGKWDT